ncbi:cytochrome bd-I ubiquinol oxidase subunit 2 apoprotein [Salsuginibacillus halophilus]|uniref:Cytochrome bd-I ubiquinol oxidase subunit 2 apoprotein n=1 Tax=Salsuginibacillus halophilus TaxID=517424 RepID=A0A2P8HBJ9_9BACI|nr:cytochrome d ubiquinol oxidase subunit II [Salsuginibacillus halophilus]PSL43598.1 cytochrome bd-I ubiquinol oxidase subunit 2 apoprotein [Salsuginibacillus halophilus]
MTYEVLGITVLWLFLYGYLIVASIDFGAGFFHYYNKESKKDYRINKLIQRYLSPVWEITNVFLVFFFIGIVGFFPDTAYYYGSALLVPGSISIILLAIRGSYYAFNTYGAKDNRLYSFLYGATGLLIPASFTVVLTISEGGFLEVTDDRVQLQYGALFSSGYSWSVVILAIVSVLYISAMFLTYYANRAGDPQAYQLFRKYALFWSAPTIAACVLIFFTLSQHNPEHFSSMISIGWVFFLSLLFFCAAVALVYQGKYLGLAFVLVMLQYGTAWFGYGASHLPYLLYPYLTIYDGFVNEAMAIALIAAFIGGLLLLIPSLYLAMRLFLFDDEYVQGKK